MGASEAGAIVPVIGIPHAGDLPGYFVDTLLHLERPLGTAVIRVENKPIDLARNLIVEGALEDEQMTHLFFMDADMQFPREALKRLVQRNLPVVGGTYFARTENPIPHGYHFHHVDNADGSCPVGMQHVGGTGTWYRPVHREFAAFMKRHPEYESEPATTCLPITVDSLLKVDGLATGCMLIKREVLEAIRDAHPNDRRPWFKCHEDSAGGEDFYFCEQARNLGFEVFIDFAIQCTHEFRPVWMERNDFKRRFKLGQEDEYDFTREMIVDASPGRAAEVLAQQSEAS